MAALYNFRNILDIDPDKNSFTCAGTNELHKPSQRCQNQILVEDREAASRILNEMDMSSTCEETLKLLPELVSRTLCTETHRSKPEFCQIGQVYTEWRDNVIDHWTLVKRESSKKSFERWRVRKVKDTLESMRAVAEDEKENDNISPINLAVPADPLLYGIKSFSQGNEYTTSSPGDEPVLDEKRNTFGNCPKISHVFGSTRDSHSQVARLSALIAELPAPPRRRTWPDDEHKIARKPLPPNFRHSTTTHSTKQEVRVEVTALSDSNPPGSPTIAVHIAPEEKSTEISPQSGTPDIPPRSPLRAPCLEHLSFVSSISCTSRDTLPSTRQITPPILDQYSSHSQGTADMTPPLPSPTPQSPHHAIPWFLREDFSVPTPELPSELPSRRRSGFRTSAVLEVDVEAEVCGVCRLARGEDSCTCNWGDLMFSSESDSLSSGSVTSRSDVKIGCLKLFGNRFKGGVGKVRRRFVGVMKLKLGGKSEDKEWIVYRWRSAT